MVMVTGGSVSSRRLGGVVATASALALVLAGCSSKHHAASSAPSAAPGGSAASSAPASTSAAPAPPAALSFSLANNSKGVSPTAPIGVSVFGGTLSQVSMKNSDGKLVAGRLASDKESWAVAEPLGYGKSYMISAHAVNADGKPVAKAESFSTVQPDNLTMPSINTAAGYSITAGGTYGVGQAIQVRFDEAIPDKAAAERALAVTTVPAQIGSWHWMDDQNVHWRPKTYFKSGTKVTVAANVYGVKVGPGLYGQSDVSTSFKIGPKQVAMVNDTDRIIHVYQNDKLVRNMPTSMGKGGSETIGGTTISFWTNSGPHIVIEKDPSVIMDSETYGLPHAAGGYKEVVYDDVKISVDGEYIHSAPWSVWAQGHSDQSHGCLNVSPENAEWYLNFAQPGDIVDVEGTPQKLQPWNSGDWTLSWAQWVAGSALSH
jgi:lipoprotein-anchoring transpeptidase ErfK/SrfK